MKACRLTRARGPLLLLALLAAGCGARDEPWPDLPLATNAVTVLSRPDLADDAGERAVLEAAFPDAPRLRADALALTGPALREAGSVLVVPRVRALTPAQWRALAHHLNRGGAAVFWGTDPASPPDGPDIPLLRPARDFFSFNGREFTGWQRGRETRRSAERLQSPLPRPTGAGGDLAGRTRWIPLATARDPESNARGWPASLHVHAPEDAPLQRWGWLGWDPSPGHADTQRALLRELAGRLHATPFLMQAGFDRHLVDPGSMLTARATVVAPPAAAGPWRVTAEMELEDGVVARRVAATVAGPGQQALLELGAMPRALAESQDQLLRVRLWDAAGQTLFDEVQQRVRLVPDEPAAPEGDRVGIRGAGFTLGRRPYTVLGAALADSPRLLDPDVFEQDELLRLLDLCREGGFNAIALRYTDLRQAPQLRLLLEELPARQLWLMLELPALNPWAADWEKARALLDALRLPPQHRIFALSPGVVPMRPDEPDCEALHQRWKAWLAEQYGDARSAIKNLGVAPEDAPPVCTLEDSPRAGALHAAARRFWSDMLSRHYGACRRFLAQGGWNMLFTAYSGFDPATAPDPAIGAHHLDFVSLLATEGEAREPERGGFLTTYARGMSGGKPVLWMHAVQPAAYPPSATALREQAETLERQSRALVRSHAAGVIARQLVGGPAGPDGADAGLLDPSGAWRPAGDRMRNLTQSWRGDQRIPAPWRGREFDSSDGAHGAWAAWRERFIEELRADRMEEMRPAGLARPSRETPAEGLIPAQERHDPAPFRYVNAEWDSDGVITARVRKGLALGLLNTGLSTWSPSVTGQVGSVWVRASRPRGRDVLIAVRETPPGARMNLNWVPADPGRWTLRPWFHPAGEFGQPLRIDVQ